MRVSHSVVIRENPPSKRCRIRSSWRLEISDKEIGGIILSRQRTTKTLIRLRIRADQHLCCSHMAKTDFLMTWCYIIIVIDVAQDTGDTSLKRSSSVHVNAIKRLFVNRYQ